jgi:hypothetical protein
MEPDFFAFYGTKIFIALRDFRIPPQCKSNLRSSAWVLKMGQIGFPETSVTNYQSTLRNI